jgi:hypothetical protein
MNTASIFCTASNAIGKIAADVLARAFEAMSQARRTALATPRQLDLALDHLWLRA